jgi:hypothetical protein
MAALTHAVLSPVWVFFDAPFLSDPTAAALIACKVTPRQTLHAGNNRTREARATEHDQPRQTARP